MFFVFVFHCPNNTKFRLCLRIIFLFDGQILFFFPFDDGIIDIDDLMHGKTINSTRYHVFSVPISGFNELSLAGLRGVFIFTIF